ncbi:hypothetical protein OZX74_06795 [Bifidobacterium sp. ESL0798]|uniref:hypothetical protein n=1 Tax=Bifidobacterium sp. ESL0798 TaxID=2983235 RepID=UPI0023F816A8|nr:hypothetical protein [Bifidobacterium sp. ESL0798]WEV73619.1 hypothetical protein OZX74_06795 [Bifidobacterium sp. ESL0798]
MSSGFKITAVVLFSLAVVCAIVAVILYFAWNIRAIRDTLTGKTAERRIAELRRESGRWKVDSRRSEVQEKETPWRADQIQIHGGSDSEPLGDSSSFVGDSISAQSSAGSEDEENAGTTLLGQSRQADGAEADGEEGLSTTLLGRDRQVGVDDEEGATTLLKGSSKGKPVASHKAAEIEDEDEPSTTLLGGASSGSSEGDDEEFSTTLLGGASKHSADGGDEEPSTTLLRGSKPKGGGRR